MSERVHTRGSERRRRRLAAAAGLLGLAAWRIMRGEHFYVLPRRVVVRRTPPHDSRPIDYERSDWDLGPVALIYAGVLVLLVICCFVLIAAYPRSLPDVTRTVRINPPGPQLQTNPAADLNRFRAEEEKRLHGYYWTDREKGLVHIPIEQAMKNLAASGIPGFGKEQP